MNKNALRCPAIVLLLVVTCRTANAEAWQCQLSEPPPSTSSFDYDIILENALTARIEVAPSKLGGVNPLDDAEAGTSRAVVLQNSADGLVLASSGTGPSRYGRGAWGQLLVINRQTSSAVQTYEIAAEKIGFANPPRMGKCSHR